MNSISLGVSTINILIFLIEVTVPYEEFIFQVVGWGFYYLYVIETIDFLYEQDY